MMTFKRILLAVGSAACLYYGAAHGHAMLETSSPPNHAVLKAAPTSIDLTFGHPTKLVALKLQKGNDIVPLVIDTSAPASKTFSIALPALAPGKYQANWSTLALDGHPMKGTLAFTVSGN
jgi:methionine-rich copper-binding protein CopC